MLCVNLRQEDLHYSRIDIFVFSSLKKHNKYGENYSYKEKYFSGYYYEKTHHNHPC